MPSACGPLNTVAASRPNYATFDILESAVKPQGRIKLGSILAEIGRKVRLTKKSSPSSRACATNIQPNRYQGT